MNRIGEDVYDAFRDKLKQLFRLRKDQDSLLVLRVIAEGEDRTVEVQIILTNPADGGIDIMLADLAKIDDYLPGLFMGILT